MEKTNHSRRITSSLVASIDKNSIEEFSKVMSWLRAQHAVLPPNNGNVKGRSAAALERRKERNKLIARKSRVRKKAEFQSLQEQLDVLQNENKRLKEIVQAKIPVPYSEAILKESSYQMPLLSTMQDPTEPSSSYSSNSTTTSSSGFYTTSFPSAATTSPSTTTVGMPNSIPSTGPSFGLPASASASVGQSLTVPLSLPLASMTSHEMMTLQQQQQLQLQQQQLQQQALMQAQTRPSLAAGLPAVSPGMMYMHNMDRTAAPASFSTNTSTAATISPSSASSSSLPSSSSSSTSAPNVAVAAAGAVGSTPSSSSSSSYSTVPPQYMPVERDLRQQLPYIEEAGPKSPWPIISGGIIDILQVAEDMDKMYPQMEIGRFQFPTPAPPPAPAPAVGMPEDPLAPGQVLVQLDLPLASQQPLRMNRPKPAEYSTSWFNSYNIPSFFMGV